ncbi:MAG: substrate-binding domain-containing protein, partial [Planctomycetales bacterium]
MLDLEWPYKRHASNFAGTQRYAEEQGWESIIDEYVYDSLSSRRAKSARYDGIIARATRPLVERAARAKTPVVNVWISSPERKSLPGVFPDFVASGRLRAEHLLARGLRNFAALGCRGDHAHGLETREFRRVIREAGSRCAVTWMALTFSRTLSRWRKTEQTIAAMMDDWRLPIGVYVGSEHVGRIVVQKCREHGWRVPEDVAIIAGMNEETLCEHPRPSLTSVEMGYERVGYEAARLLHRLMDGEQPPSEPILLAPQGLVVRESTDFFAVEDELVAAALEFISRNSHRRIGQDDVSRAVNAETRTLQLRFRKVLDRPIAAEIRRVRVERAKRELSQSNRRLSDVARDVGFGEAMRMYEVFRRELGVTPSEYRK